MKLTILGSSSAGNCAVVSTKESIVLVDAGLGARETLNRLADCGISPESITSLVLSHSHGDHCRGARQIAERLMIPVYVSSIEAPEYDLGPRVDVRMFNAGCMFTIDDIHVFPFEVSHDSAQTCAFTIEAEGRRISIVNDLGYVDTSVLGYCWESDTVVIEANHDPEAVREGRYQVSVKKRILGHLGHLSNEQTAAAVAELKSRTKHIVLSHISQDNNDPKLARLTVLPMLRDGQDLKLAQEVIGEEL